MISWWLLIPIWKRSILDLRGALFTFLWPVLSTVVGMKPSAVRVRILQTEQEVKKGSLLGTFRCHWKFDSKLNRIWGGRDRTSFAKNYGNHTLEHKYTCCRFEYCAYWLSWLEKDLGRLANADWSSAAFRLNSLNINATLLSKLKLTCDAEYRGSPQ